MSLTECTVAIRTLWPEIFWSLGNMTLPSNKVKLAVQEVDYKPFISLFNVTNATVTNPEISGIGKESTVVHLHRADMKHLADYASAVALELSKNTAGEYSVALKFKNGTNDNEFKPLKMFGQDSLTFPQLISALDVSSLASISASDPLMFQFFFFSGPPLTRLSTGASLATKLCSVDAPFTTTAMILSLTPPSLAMRRSRGVLERLLFLSRTFCLQ
jgi:hypothetical protein